MPGYGDDIGFEDYAVSNGYDIPSGNVTAARLRGSVYLDGHYYQRWPGEPTGGVDQERSWPRKTATDRFGNAVDDAAVPARVVSASYEATLLELQTPGFFAKTFTEADKKVLVKVQSISWVHTGNTKGDRSSSPVSTVIENILAPILTPSGSYLPAALIVS